MIMASTDVAINILKDPSHDSRVTAMIATQERWILVAVDGSGQCRLPLVRFCLIYYELAHCVASKYVFKYVERKSEHFGS